jgi:signal transduction histidine kinase
VNLRALRLTFRTKLMAIVGIAAVAFVLIIAAGALISQRVERQLATIQQRFLPKVELGPQLEGQLERIGRGLQDAVAARDPEALAATSELVTRFGERLASAPGALDPADVAALRSAVEDYYSAGHDVARRLIAAETGEALVDAVAAMQAKQARAGALLKRTVTLDQRDLSEAFAAANRAERAAGASRLWISLACLTSVMLLSLWLGRGALRSLAELTVGFLRFSKGDFNQPIPIVSRDEIGEVAQEANRMAASLERLGRERDKAERALKLSNQELEAFSYSVAHDLRAPLRGLNGFSQALLEDLGDKLDGEAKDYLQRISAGAERMGELIDSLLALSRVSRTELRHEDVNMARLADAVVRQLRISQPDRVVDFANQVDEVAQGDPVLLRAVLENLIGNAWKFTGARPAARITFGSADQAGLLVYFVRDNGAGFDMAYADKLFAPFQRLHGTREFPGTGIGLATVQRIVNRHGGRIWAEGEVNRGATFYFTLSETTRGALA